MPRNKDRLYGIWCGIQVRCTNPNTKAYEWYGAKGIRRCEEWNSFESFKEWSLANGYESNLTIDRRDSNGNYEPTNCRWIPLEDQRHNRKPRRNSTGIPGITKNAGRYRARHEGIHVGYGNTPEEAKQKLDVYLENLS